MYATHERTKLTAQSVQCDFLRYSTHHKGFLCYDPEVRRIWVSENVIFVDHHYFFSTYKASLVVLPNKQEYGLDYDESFA